MVVDTSRKTRERCLTLTIGSLKNKKCYLVSFIFSLESPLQYLNSGSTEEVKQHPLQRELI